METQPQLQNKKKTIELKEIIESKGLKKNIR